MALLYPIFRSVHAWSTELSIELKPVLHRRGSWSVDRVVAKWHHRAMIPVAEESRSRITARVPDRMRETLEQAAELMGSTVNQFVVQSAYQEAQRILERESVIRLSREDALKILSLIEHPPKPNKRLKEAVRLAKSTVRA